MGRRIRIIGVYTMATILGCFVFPYSWLTEQRHAVVMAYWDSIGSALEHAAKYAERIRNERETE